jgi:hypothetical protein
MGVLVDGSKVRIFGTKKSAQDAARSIGWPVGCVSPVETRFQMAYALGMGVDLDPYTNLSHMSRERFGELYRARNGNAEPTF